MSIPNKIIIITAPSGAGKTSITRFLMKTFPQLAFSVSAATREARGMEKDGVDYHFMSEKRFNEKVKNNEFVEWEMVYQGKYYGTLKTELEKIWSENKIPVLDIDVKGAIRVKEQYPDSTLTIFIDPPSVDVLKIRLESRGTESKEAIAARVHKATSEIAFKDRFDKRIVNDQLQRACEEAEIIVKDFVEA
jgi:guanylate kinase